MGWIEEERGARRAGSPVGKEEGIALELPSLYSELEGPALGGIVQQLGQIGYLNEIVVTLDQASALEFRRAKDDFKCLPQHVRLVWVDGPGMQEILGDLTSLGINVGFRGKASSVG